MKESLREQLKLRENTINKLKNELLATKVRENAKIKILKEDSNYCREELFKSIKRRDNELFKYKKLQKEYTEANEKLEKLKEILKNMSKMQSKLLIENIQCKK